MDANEIGMIKAFGDKILSFDLISVDRVENFEGNFTSFFRIVGEKDVGVPASSQFGDDRVVVYVAKWKKEYPQAMERES